MGQTLRDNWRDLQVASIEEKSCSGRYILDTKQLLIAPCGVSETAMRQPGAEVAIFNNVSSSYIAFKNHCYYYLRKLHYLGPLHCDLPHPGGRRGSIPAKTTCARHPTAFVPAMPAADRTAGFFPIGLGRRGRGGPVRRRHRAALLRHLGTLRAAPSGPAHRADLAAVARGSGCFFACIWCSGPSWVHCLSRCIWRFRRSWSGWPAP